MVDIIGNLDPTLTKLAIDLGEVALKRFFLKIG